MFDYWLQNEESAQVSACGGTMLNSNTIPITIGTGNQKYLQTKSPTFFNVGLLYILTVNCAYSAVFSSVVVASSVAGISVTSAAGAASTTSVASAFLGARPRRVFLAGSAEVEAVLP
jgi:hypothetical protein